MDEKAPKIDDKKFAAHMDKNKKPKTMSSTQKSLADIRKRGEIVRSKKSTAQMRNSAGLKRLGDAMITPKMQRRALASPAAKAKPKSQVTLPKMPKLSIDKDKNKTNEAFDFKVNIDGFPEMFMSGNSPSEVKTHLRKLVKQPSMIQSVDRVTKADKKKHHRDKVRESVEEGMKYTHAAIDKSGKVIGMASQESDAKDMARRNKGRVVKLKKPMSDKKGDMMINRPFKESVYLEEKEEKKGLWYNIHMKRKRGEKMRKKGEKGAPTADQMARAKGEAVSDAQRSAIAMDMKARGKKPKGDKVDELSLSTKDITKSGINPTVSKDKDKIKKDLEKLRKGLKDQLDKNSVREKVEYVEYKFKNERDAKAAKKYFDGIQLMSFDVNDDNVRGGKLMVDSGKKDMTKYHKEVMKKFRPKVTTQEKKEPLKAGYYSRKDVQKQTGEKGTGTDTYKPKPKESYAPDEGTPEAKKKATKMTPGQTSKENFFKNLGNKIMGNKPTANQVRRSTGMSSRVNTNRNSTSGNQNSIANRINLGGKYGNK